MAILRALNEFVRESIVLALEPSRKCVASCTYCFATLNSQSQVNNRSKSLKDDSTFERILERAYSPSYDPTNFLEWGVRNKLVLGWANTVEPWQDTVQAIGILNACRNFDLPLFVQTKGINFDSVKNYLKPFYNNSSIFVSIPSLDDRVIKRFEPGTPKISDRLKMIDWLSDQGFWVIAAISPMHEDWIESPNKYISTLHDHGVKEIFTDRLHLNQRQYEITKDRVMADMAGGRMKVWPQKALDCLKEIYETALDNGLEFYNAGFMGTCFGFYNTLSTISPDSCFSRGLPWMYNDGSIFQALESVFYNDEVVINDRHFEDSILLTWQDALAIMEINGGISQEFSYSGLMDIIPIYKKIPPSWKRSIGITSTKSCAPMSEWYRCLWNNPYRNQFCWRHPWLKAACDMNGIPMVDNEGNLLAIFDPDWDGKPFRRYFRKVENLDVFRRLEIEAKT